MPDSILKRTRRPLPELFDAANAEARGRLHISSEHDRIVAARRVQVGDANAGVNPAVEGHAGLCQRGAREGAEHGQREEKFLYCSASPCVVRFATPETRRFLEIWS